MTQKPLPIGDDELHAYADGQLDAARREAIDAWLAEHPEEAARVNFYTRINMALHERFDAVLAEPVPAAMTHPPHRRRRTMLRQFGVAAACLIVGLVGGWFAREAMWPAATIRASGTGPAIAREAALAHALYTVEVRHPVEVGAGEDHLLRWLSNRMGRPVKAPLLNASGFRLMGGRLLPNEEGGVACQFMYENVNGARVTLYYAKRAEGATRETAFRYVEERDGLSVFYWLDEKMGYAISGRMPRDNLLTIAHEIYEQLDK